MRTIRAERLVLEPQAISHAEEMFEVLSDPAIYEFENEPPRSLDWLRERFRKLESRRSADGVQHWLNWVIRVPDSGLIGYVQATVYPDGRAAIAYELASRYWGRGFASEAVLAIVPALSQDYGVRRLTAVFKQRNHRSQRLLEHLGFSAASPALHAELAVEPDERLMLKELSSKGDHMASKFILLAAAACIALGGNVSFAAEIKVLASPGVRGAVSALVPPFERATRHKVVTEFVVIAVIKRKIEAGEAFDLAIPSPELIDELVKQGRVAADTRTVFGRTGLGVAARQGIPTPDISTVDAFKRTLLSAKSVGHSREGQTGVNFLIVLDKLGIAPQMKPKLKTYQGNELAEALEKGIEEIGVTGIGPVLEMNDVQKLGGLPPEIQRYVNFSAGVSATSKEPDAARELLKFMMTPEAAAVAKGKGLER